MSNRARNVLAVLLTILMALVAFGAGYLANEVLGQRASAAALSEAQLGIFFEAWDRIEESFIGELPSQQARAYGAVRGSIEVLNDPYTVFVEPAARDVERALLRGNTGGIGVTLVRNEAGDIVLSPIAGNPAEAAGILEGDRLLAVDGTPVTGEMTVQEAAELIRGEAGTEVTVTVVHPGQTDSVEIVVERTITILLPSVEYRLLAEEPTIGYIRLERFTGESAGEVESALEALKAQGATGLILDLRQNSGGLLDAAVDVSDHFLDGGPVLYQISREQREEVFESSNGTLADGLPLVVLVDGTTASSAEIVAGALQDRGRATLIGERTFGKGSVQLVYDLSDGSSVHVTSARWLTPDRHQIDQQGIEPDIVAAFSEEAHVEGRDTVLERAIAFLDQ
ncbi:MAG: S41 family peptidase [Candidatus Promineifilaceae bacterium]|nr:S41 family peptidase [Candidatus Promineifilaceae bacterium]